MTDLVNRTLTISASGVNSCSSAKLHWQMAGGRQQLTHPDDRECKSLDEWSKRAQIRPEQLGQHVDSLVYEVDCRTTRSCLRVHCIVGQDKVGYVSDICKSAKVEIDSRDYTHGPQLRYCHLVVVERVARHQYLYILYCQLGCRCPDMRHTWGIDTADLEIPQILTISPNHIILLFGWDHPRLSLNR